MQLYNYFKPQTGWTCSWDYQESLRMGNTNWEIKSLLIGAENNAIRSNHTKAKIDYTPKNLKGGWFENRNDSINDKINKCSELSEKDIMSKHDWVGK